MNSNLKAQEKLNEGFNEILLKERLKRVFTRLVMLAKLNRITESMSKEERDRIAARIFMFVRGETCQETEEVRR